MMVQPTGHQTARTMNGTANVLSTDLNWQNPSILFSVPYDVVAANRSRRLLAIMPPWATALNASKSSSKSTIAVST